MKICRSCKKEIKVTEDEAAEFNISAGICIECKNKVSTIRDAKNNKTILDLMNGPVLLMQPLPRQVCTANKKAAELFSKNLSGIEGRRGGQVFDCVHSFSEAGCGMDPNCENCKIKNAIVETFQTGKTFKGISTPLEIKKQGITQTYIFEISTEKIGELALLRIDQCKKI